MTGFIGYCVPFYELEIVRFKTSFMFIHVSMHEHCVVLCLDFSQTKAQIAIHLANLRSSSHSPTIQDTLFKKIHVFDINFLIHEVQ